MIPAPPVHRSAAALLAANLGIGLAPFVLCAGFHPLIRWHGVIPLGICLLAAFSVSWFLSPARTFPRNPGGPSPLRRLLSCLLLGASLAAIPFKQQSLPFASIVLGIGFGLRWWLFIWETLDLHRADQRFQPLPCAATRVRHGCTLVAGALIPLLLIAGLPTLPLLWISLILTLFCQWTAGEEACHSFLHHRSTSSIEPAPMNGANGSNGGIY